MDKKFKQNLQLIAFGVVLFVVLIYYKDVLTFIRYIWSLFLPVTTGLIIALILNVPSSGIFNFLDKIRRKTKLKINDKILHIISIIITVICLFLVLFFIAYLVIPEVITSTSSLISSLSVSIPKWIKELEEMNIDTTFITNALSGMDFSQWNNMLTSYLSSVLGGLSTTVMNSFNFMLNFFISLTIAIYALLDKKSLALRANEFLYAMFNKKIADEIKRVSSLTNKSISDFFGGQTIEAMVLGIFMFVAFTIFKLPYASLIALLAAVGSFIPYIGATLANIIGSFLIFLVQPSATILSIIVYQAVQFIETQFIYPRVVGKAVGISPLLTLIAVLIGGKLFGVLGIIFSLPITAVVSSLVKEYIFNRLEEKEIKIEDEK